MPTDSRTETEAFIGLGSNLADPMEQIQRAVTALGNIPRTRLLHHSPWYRSRAIGPGEQPDYVNGVALLATALDATELFSHLQRIEAAQGRERRVRWAARTLDLDILLYGSETIHSPQLQIPHPRLTGRNFVIYPLADIRPELVLPDGTHIQTLVANCGTEGLARQPDPLTQE